MKIKSLILIFLLYTTILGLRPAVVHAELSTQAPESDSVYHSVYRGVVQISFHGYSTFHDFRGRAVSEPFEYQTASDTSAADTSTVTRIEVYAESLATPNNALNENMHSTLEAEKFPVIAGMLNHSAFLNIRKGTQKPTEFRFRLKIRNSTRIIKAVSSGFFADDDSLGFHADFSVSLSAYRLEPPTLLLGSVRVKDTIDIRTRVRMHRIETKQ